jgi:hypothetical protein
MWIFLLLPLGVLCWSKHLWMSSCSAQSLISSWWLRRKRTVAKRRSAVSGGNELADSTECVCVAERSRGEPDTMHVVWAKGFVFCEDQLLRELSCLGMCWMISFTLKTVSSRRGENSRLPG